MPAWSARAAPNCCGCWPASTGLVGHDRDRRQAASNSQPARRHRRRHRPGAGGAQARRHRAAALDRQQHGAASMGGFSPRGYRSHQARSWARPRELMQRSICGRSCSTGRSACSAAATSRRRSSAAGWRRDAHPSVRRADTRHRCRRQGGDLPSDRGARRRGPFRHRRLLGAARGDPARRPVLVMRDGRIAAELDRDSLSEEAIVAHAVPQSSRRPQPPTAGKAMSMTISNGKPHAAAPARALSSLSFRCATPAR